MILAWECQVKDAKEIKRVSEARIEVADHGLGEAGK